MPTVELPIGNRTYELACVAGEENRLRELAGRVHAKVSDMGRAMPGASDPLLLVMTAITLQDSLDEAASSPAPIVESAPAHTAAASHEEIDQLAVAIDAIATFVEGFAQRLESEMQQGATSAPVAPPANATRSQKEVLEFA